MTFINLFYYKPNFQRTFSLDVRAVGTSVNLLMVKPFTKTQKAGAFRSKCADTWKAGSTPGGYGEWGTEAGSSLLMLPPLVFLATDLVENLMLFLLVQSYPTLSPETVAVASSITQLKRSMFYISAVELILSLLMLLIGFMSKRSVPAW